jgi:hypothetical protein
VEEISEEKKKIEKTYFSLLVDVKKFTNETKKKLIHQNFHKIMADTREDEEMEELKNGLGALKEG